MWLWRVCATGMEKIITDLTVFEGYKDRQVVLNYYKDEDFLYDREGFHFHAVQFEKEFDQLKFTKIDGSDWTLSLKDYPKKYLDSQFPNYYVLTNGTDRLEIYFPS